MKSVIHIGCDHAGYELKNYLKGYLQSQGFIINDYGTNGPESVDYPDFAHKVAKAVETNNNHLGILICGSGNGINMAANKHTGIRSALCWMPEIAELARKHNNANVLALPGRFISTEQAEKITDAFLKTQFEGGRHQNRIDKINCR
jgi:ribose 5-phosphate isomerase B